MNEYESLVAETVKSRESDFGKFVVPLIIPSTKSKKSAPEFVGTEFIVQHQSVEYLISANHVVEEFAKRKNPIYSFGPKSTGLFEFDTAHEFYCSFGDIAIIQIATVKSQGLIAYEIEPEKLFEATDNIIHVWGYPGSKNKNLISRCEAIPLGLTVKIINSSIDRTGNETFRNAALDRENFVEPGMCPHPHGMSGSPVFSLGAERMYVEQGREHEREFKLIGVYTETHTEEKICQYELLNSALFACREKFTYFAEWGEYQATTVY